MWSDIARMCSILSTSIAKCKIDRLNYTLRKVGVQVSTLIHVSSTTRVSMVHSVYVSHLGFVSVCVSVKCWCGALAINQVRLGPAAERGLQWATHPARRSGEIQCP